MNRCFSCGGDAIFYSPRSKRWRCQESINKCIGKRTNDSIKKKGINPWKGQTHPRLGIKGKSPPTTGKTLEECYGKEIADKMKLAVSRASHNLDRKTIFDNFSEEKKEGFRKRMRENRIGGYIKGSGRGKKGWYKGIWCDSSWELAYVIYCIDHDINITRYDRIFEYMFNGKKFTYKPDFLINSNEIIEIKGWFDSKTYAKLQQCNVQVTLIDKNEIKPYLAYVKARYGKNFINLYESIK